MTQTYGRYHFRSWVRRGVGADAGHVDAGVIPARASLDVTIEVTAVQAGVAVDVVPAPKVTVQLFGPGDVIGIDPRHIIRTEPRNLTMNFEPNYLAAIEFDQPDFPWLFTPALPNGDRLRPWLALIVLKDGEYDSPAVAPNPLPVIDVTAMAALQALTDSWNWAHAQISADADLTTAMAGNPAATISRLLCPRRLDPETSYTAFLVPAFDIGREAGLGTDVSAVVSATPAWSALTPAPLRLPVYYRFEFRTSDAGDFESLVRKLTPTVLPAAVGIAAMAVDHPADGVPSAGTPLGLEGALRSISTVSTPWTGPDRDAFQAAVQVLVNEGTTASVDDPDSPLPDDPRIVPPAYGKWHAGALAVDRSVPGWLPDLNLDPRNRTGAGMGTQIVQGQRVALMASAWAQVDGLLSANAVLRQAQLSRAALHQLWNQHLRPAGVTTLLMLTSPVHARILASPRTVAATVGASRIPARLLSGTFRRTARPLGPLARRAATLAGLHATGPGGLSARAPLAERLNAGDVQIASLPPAPGGMTSIDQVSDSDESAAAPTWLPGWLRRLLTWLAARLGARLPLVVLGLALVLAVALVLLGLLLGAAPALMALLVLLAAALVIAAWVGQPLLTRLGQRDSAAERLRFAQLTGAVVREGPPAARFVVTDPPSGLGVAGAGAAIPGATTTAAAGTDSPDAALLRAAAASMFDAVHAVPVDPPMPGELDLVALRATVVVRLDPADTVPARIASMVATVGGPWFAADPIEPIMAAPSFPQPMYEPLRDLNESYLLPGVSLIPPDCLGAVVANHEFIEAYMVGLNHEMARQLLWNGYPTDQRGSYFRQFWDVAAYSPQPGDPTDAAQLTELLKDIPPIHTWPSHRPLGQNENRTDVPVDNVVLLVRGELLRRYPNTDIFAGKAKMGTGGEHGRVLDESDERHPMFRGTLAPDITFFGFNLSVDDARGGTPASPEGFFFAFQEQVTETRFGLEPQTSGTVTRWADLGWTSFGGAAPGSPGAGTPRPAVAERVVVDPGSGNLTASSVSSVFPSLLPGEISAYRVASSVFASILARTSIPDFLTAADPPSGVALDGSNAEDTAAAWGKDAAQTAAIMLRLPFRILVHADSLLPARTP
ncbi:MAG: hypothetical protein ACOH17_07240 [Cellulomonas sp.]